VAHFIALYTGRSLSSARLVSVSSDPSIVRDFVGRLLREPPAEDDDPVAASLERGRRAALRLIQKEASGANGA
jgi:hypothetical protein